MVQADAKKAPNAEEHKFVNHKTRMELDGAEDQMPVHSLQAANGTKELMSISGMEAHMVDLNNPVPDH